jgi:hypothetical protein
VREFATKITWKYTSSALLKLMVVPQELTGWDRGHDFERIRAEKMEHPLMITNT